MGNFISELIIEWEGAWDIKYFHFLLNISGDEHQADI